MRGGKHPIQQYRQGVLNGRSKRPPDWVQSGRATLCPKEARLGKRHLNRQAGRRASIVARRFAPGGCSMRRSITVILVLSGFFLGLNLARALHEVAQAGVALLLGGKVEWVRLFRTAVSPVDAHITGLSQPWEVLVGLGALAATTGTGSLIAWLIPWPRLSNTTALTGAVLLLPFALYPLFLAFVFGLSSGENDPTTSFFLPPMVLNLLLLAWCVGCVWFWWRRTGFPAHRVYLEDW